MKLLLETEVLILLNVHVSQSIFHFFQAFKNVKAFLSLQAIQIRQQAGHSQRPWFAALAQATGTPLLSRRAAHPLPTHSPSD